MADQAGPNTGRLQAVDAAILTPLVQQAFDNSTITVPTWEYQPMHGGIGGSVGGTFLYRFSGQGHSQEGPVPWSLILKVIQARPGEIPSDTHYWKREAEAYRSDLLRDMPGSMYAAWAFEVLEYENEFCWIWLEDVREDLSPKWPLEHYAVAARHLGQFNGAYLDQPWPAEPWLSTGWFHTTLDRLATPAQPGIHESLKHPDLRQHFPPDASDQYAQLWAQRETFMNILDRLPQTLCHLDAFRRNLFARKSQDGGYETVAIDWAHLGKAAVTVDAAVLVQVSLMFQEIEVSEAEKLVSLVFEAYLDGLRDMGWQGDPRHMWLGFSAASVLKYLEMSGSIQMAVDPAGQKVVEQDSGKPIGDWQRQIAGMLRLACVLAEKAQGLSNLLD